MIPIKQASDADTVAVLNTNAETLEGLALALSDAGFHPVTLNTVGSTRTDLARFIDHLDPDVVVFDIAPPYLEAMRHWNEGRQASSEQDRPFVLMTTGRGLDVARFGDETTEIVEKPFSFTRLVRAVERAARRRRRDRS